MRIGRSEEIGRERTGRFKAPGKGKRTFVVNRRAAAHDPSRSQRATLAALDSGPMPV